MNINEILSDLYLVDPSLREMEAELKEIINKLAGSRPESEPDKNFKERLKQEILNKIETDKNLAAGKAPGAGSTTNTAGQAVPGESKSKKLLPFRRVSLFRGAGITAAAALAVVLGLQFFNVQEDGVYLKNEGAPIVSSSDTDITFAKKPDQAYQTEEPLLDSEEGDLPADREKPIEAATATTAVTLERDAAPAEEQKDTINTRPEPVVEQTKVEAAAPPTSSADVSSVAESPAEPSSTTTGPVMSLMKNLFGGRTKAAESAPAPTIMMQRAEAPLSGIVAYDDAGSGYAEEYLMEEDEMAFDGMFEPAEEFNTEEYARIRENEFIQVMDEPISTFSIDVDTASYANVRRFLNEGRLPTSDAVRIEELINYFSYDYPQPEGDAPFSFTTETARSPWNGENLILQIGLQGYDVAKEDMPPSNMVFLLDVSGSMSDANKLPLLKESMALLIDTLGRKDRISIVAYAGAAGLVLPPTNGSSRQKILSAMDRLEAGGSTAGGEGIELAYAVAEENFIEGGNNRIIIATDGDFNVGQSSQGELTRLIEKEREKGIFLTVLGLGMGNYKDNRMESIADSGNGNYAYIDTINEARKVLVNEMESTLLTIAKDVKIQIEFNPAVVESYRLIGYENRLLANRDFNDDTKDAGEIGAGHTVTALYEIIPAPGVTGSAVSETEAGQTELRYQETTVRDSASSDFAGELGFIKFRYKAPDSDTSTLITSPVGYRFNDFGQASENLRFAASVAEWGMLLRGSSYLPEEDPAIPLSRLISVVKKTLGEDEFGYRAEFLTLLHRTKSLMN
ncbi:MAG: VWA domain-containing protein [Spirochaetales bacterium]|nr:VWA domain-containing protein [Spirochaetales bacterium]